MTLHGALGCRRIALWPLLATGATLILAACGTSAAALERPDAGHILMAGEIVSFGVPVVTPVDPGGFDARVERRWFEPREVLPGSPAAGCETPSRASARRVADWPTAAQSRVASEGWTAELLRERVDLFVLHYDAAVTSQNCFRVLHDARGLSVHFLLDVDGTLYQTLDLTARARHAGSANDRSIGIEIANPGAYPEPAEATRFYGHDATGLRLDRSARLGTPPGAPFRPSRPTLVSGPVHGHTLHQVDFTDAQYETLARLLPALARLLPRIALDAPRDATGSVRTTALEAAELAAFSGIVGHHHLTTRKVDPGPAFDWARVLGTARPSAQRDQATRERTAASISVSSGNSPVSSLE